METPLEKLKKMTAWTVAPALTEAELAELLIQSSVADSAGNGPLHVDWTPTYDINNAAAEGWMIKAARASEQTEVDPPGSGIVTSKVFDNCRAMARLYSTRKRVSAATGPKYT